MAGENHPHSLYSKNLIVLKNILQIYMMHGLVKKVNICLKNGLKELLMNTFLHFYNTKKPIQIEYPFILDWKSSISLHSRHIMKNSMAMRI